MNLFFNANKILTLLSSKEKLKFILLSIVLFIGGILELISLSALIPLISILTENKEEYLSFDFTISDLILEFFGGDVKLFYFSLFILLYIARTIFLVILSFRSNSFINNLTASFSKRLFNIYIHKPYLFYLKTNSSSLVKNFQIEISNLIQYIKGLIKIFTESFLMASVLLVLIISEPLPAISVGGMVILVAVIYLGFIKSKIVNLAYLRETLDNNISRIAIETFSSIKDIKINNNGSYFLKEFEINQFKKSRVSALNTTINEVPRFFLELLIVFGLSLYTILMMYLEHNITKTITTLALFLAASFRIIPSINKIILGFQSVKYFQNSFDILYEEFTDYHKSSLVKLKKEKFIWNDSISIDNLSFSYPQKVIFKNLNLKILKGSILGIKGLSGAGKSTFVDLISGLLIPQKGKIYVDNNVLGQHNLDSWTNLIGYVPQSVRIIDDSIRKNIAFGIKNSEIDEEKLKEAAITSSVVELFKTNNLNFDSICGENGNNLSGGQKQRIGIARALYKNPELLILDESTASLDNKTESEILSKIIKLKGNMTILIISHSDEVISYCDKVLEL